MAQLTAALVGTQLSFLILTFLPPIAWLVFYLRQDRHPEPKGLILLTFAAGMGAAVAALVAECAFLFAISGGSCQSGISSGVNALILFAGISLIEEYLKYLPVRLLIIGRRDFDEPIDGMIYLMTSAMGFAALENALFLFPLFNQSVYSGLAVTANRFLGANFLHVLSSGIVGFCLARAYFSPRRHHFIALGIFIASLLHTAFNYLILVREDLSQGLLYIILLLALAAVVVFVELERLRKAPTPPPPPPPVSPPPQ